MRVRYHLVHENGPALWPEHLSEEAVLELKATTPPLVWSGTYQTNPTPSSGYVFRREWWTEDPESRYDPLSNLVTVARFQSWDLAEKDSEENDWTVGVTADVLADYRVAIRDVYRERLTFDRVPSSIVGWARQWNKDEKLSKVIIEDHSSGTPAYQTLRATSAEWLKQCLVAFRPVGGKVERANAASVWCANGMVLLPVPSNASPWLFDFEDELFSFPQGTWDDQVDAFSQVIIFCEHFLAAGYRRGYVSGHQ